MQYSQGHTSATPTHHTATNNNNRSISQIPDGTVPIPMGSGTIVNKIGEGGSAVIFKTWNERLGVDRAIKLLKPTTNVSDFQQFEQETKILGQLNHPNIINIHHFSRWQSLPYIEMDLVEGLSLDKIIKESGDLPIVVALAMAIDIAKALDYTHTHTYQINGAAYTGLLHQDLKPANILVPRNGPLKLTDFGIASLCNVSGSTTRIKSGIVSGSMQYMAPEQLDNDKNEDYRSDIYSYGLILYEMLVGEKAFPEKSIARLVKMRVQNDYIPIKKRRVKAPRKIIDLIDKMLSKNAQDRPHSFKDILNVLEGLYKTIEVTKRPEQIVTSFMNGEIISNTSMNKHRTGQFFKHIFNAIKISFIIILVAIGGYFGYKYLSEYITEFKKPSKFTLSITTETIPILQENLKEYGFSDAYSLLLHLISIENFSLASKIIDKIPLSEKNDKKWLRLFEYRTVVGLGKESSYYYENNHISDSEYHLGKSIFLIKKGYYSRALSFLKIAEDTETLLKKSDNIERDIVYYRALAKTEQLNHNKIGLTKEDVITSWNEVLEITKNDKKSYYHKQALLKLSRLKRE